MRTKLGSGVDNRWLLSSSILDSVLTASTCRSTLHRLVLNYSSKLTTNGTWNPGFGPENAFNGNTSTGSRAETSDGTVTTLDLSSNPVAIGSSLKVMVGSNGPSGGTMTLNGNANTAVSITNSYTEYTIPLDSETELSTLTFNSDTGIMLVYFKVDDSVLVDHSSIGVDMSGNNNNFYDQNFGVRS